VFQLRSAEQKRLSEYCRHRMEELKQFAPVVHFFGVEEKLATYIRDLGLILQELGGRNSDADKEDNVFHLLVTQGCSMFFDDVSAICGGNELPLPEDVLEIPAHLAEKERKKTGIRGKTPGRSICTRAQSLGGAMARRRRNAKEETPRRIV